MSEQLVTIPQLAREFELDKPTQHWLYKRLYDHALLERGPRGALLYPRMVAIQILQKHRPAKGTPWGTGGFPPADDIVWCPCGKSYVDNDARSAHITRDHGGVAPVQTSSPPVYRFTVEDAADEQATFQEHRRRVRNYPKTPNQPDAVST